MDSKPSLKINYPVATKDFYKKFIGNSYSEAHRAKEEGKLVAWIYTTAPTELLWAFDILPVWPENYAALCAARQLSLELCKIAEMKGISKDLCSYARTCIGSLYVERSMLPEGGMPSPDLLIVSTGACNTHYGWSQFISRKFKVPILFIDMPYNKTGATGAEIEDEIVEQTVAQLQEFIEALERITGSKLDNDKLKKVLELSSKASELWIKIMELRQSVPCPIDSRIAFSTVYLMLCYAGHRLAVEFYEKFYRELKQRVENKVGIIDDELFRVIWHNLPPWYDLDIFTYMLSRGVVSVMETFSLNWIGILDKEKPLESLARKYLASYSNCSLKRKMDLILYLAKNWKADGAILARNRGCRFMCIGENEIKNRLYEELGIPSLIIDIDPSDPRTMSPLEIRQRLDSFIDLLKKA